MSPTMLQDDYTPGSIAALLGSASQDCASKTELSQLFAKRPNKPVETTLVHQEKVRLSSQKQNGDPKHDETQRKSVIGPGRSRHETEVKASSDKKLKRDGSNKFTKSEKERQESMEDQNKRSVFVGHLPVTIKKKRLKKMFQKYGKVESIRFRSFAPEDPKLPKKAIAAMGKFNPKVDSLNAYVVFTDASAAEKATELNNAIIDGKHIRVDFIGSKSNQHDHRRSIFIGNLPFEVEEEEVRKHFSECGLITCVRLVRDKATRLGKGFGYVLFENQDSVLLSLKLNGKKFKGRSLRVQRSTPNPQTGKRELKRVKKAAKSAADKKRRHSNTDNAAEDDTPKKQKKLKKADRAVKEEKHRDSNLATKEEGFPKKQKKIAVKFDTQTGKLKLQKKDKLKKKLKRRLERKKKQTLAHILIPSNKEQK